MAEPIYDKNKCSEFILSKIEEGLSLFKACEIEGMPNYSTFLMWCREDAALANNYARAREVRADRMVEQMIEIANTEHQTEIINESSQGVTVTRLDHDKHRRLQIDTIKWAVSKMAPKKYGDKLDVTTGGEKLAQPTISLNYKGSDVNLSE